MCICTRFTCAAECVALPNKTKRPNTNRTVFLISSLLINLAHATISPPRVEQTNLRSRKTDTLRPAELDQECEMLDVPGIRIVRMNSLKVRSKYDLRIEGGGIHDDDSIRRSTLSRRKVGGTAASGAARFGAIQVAANSSYRSFRPIAPRLLAAIGHFRHRAHTFLLMRTNAAHHREHEHSQHCRCNPLSYHCGDYS